jgi:hypothetical protein
LKPDTLISSLSRLTKDHALGLGRLSITTIKDLLFLLPTRYADSREEAHVANLEKGQSVTIYGVMEKVVVRRSFKGHIPLTEARIADGSGTIRAIWFNQAYIGKMYAEGYLGILKNHAPLVTTVGKGSLKFSDISGKEVSVLVNEYLRPGVYKIDFNGSKLTSGIYVYRMSSGSFTEAKKMVLVK